MPNKNRKSGPTDELSRHLSVGIQSTTVSQAKEKFDEITSKIKKGEIKPPPLYSTTIESDWVESQIIPKTLNQIKELCPKNLTGLDRSAWIADARKKFNV